MLVRWPRVLGTYWEPVGFRACCCLRLVLSVLLVPLEHCINYTHVAARNLRLGHLRGAHVSVQTFAGLMWVVAGERLRYML